MTGIEGVINAVLLEQKERLSDSTFALRRCYLNKLLKMAKQTGIESPCQELYDLFSADDYGSKERRFHLDHCIKLVDRHAKTHARRQNGKLYNEPALPDIEDARAVLEEISYPVESLDIGTLIVKAEQEMGHLALSASTVGQYRHAWMDIYRYFFFQGRALYCKTIVQEFIDQITSLREHGQMKEWKWKINRKAAYVLIEVADSGRFRWSTISQDLRIADEGLEEVRGRYLFYLKSHNLQPATISLHDYVFRFALGHARITTLFELMSLSPDHIRDVVTGFSSVCSRRSLSTILPIVRKVLDFLYEEGFVRSRLSGMVMGAFVQRGNVAAYISPDDEKKLLAGIERGSRRDKAIVLLLLRLGLRECDICELTLQEIEWQFSVLTDNSHCR